MADDISTVNEGKWVQDTTTTTWKYQIGDDSSPQTIVMLTGVASTETADTLKNKVTFSKDDGAGDIITITLKDGVFDATADGTAKIDADMGYKFALDSGLKTDEEFDPSSLELSSEDHKTINGGLKAYYTLTDSKTIKYTAQKKVKLAEISELKNNATLSDTNVKLENGIITLSKEVLPDSDGSSVSINQETSGYLGETVPISSLDLGLKLSFSSTDNPTIDSATNVVTIGFGSANNKWLVDESNKTTATYNTVTNAGWTLKDNTITYTKEEVTPVVTISGLKGNLVLGNTTSGSTSKDFVGIEEGETPTFKQGISITDTKITIQKEVLPTNADKNVSIKVTGDTNYTFALGQLTEGDEDKPKNTDASPVNNNDNKIGFKNSALYWAIDTVEGATTKTATYQYDTAQGWELEGSDKDYTIKYTAAKNKTNATGIFTIEGLNTSLTASSDSVGATIDGFTAPDNNGIIKLDAEKVFPNFNSGQSATITLKKVEGNQYTSEDPTYKIKLSDDNLLNKLTIADDPSAQLSTISTEGKATLTGTTQKYYETDETTNSITYYAENTAAELATIEGLKASEASGVSLNDTDKKIINLTDAVLDGKDIKLVQKTTEEIAGIATYTLKLAIENENTTIATADKQLATDSVSSIGSVETASDGKTKTATITGTKKAWYESIKESDGDNAPVTEIKYHESESDTIATITGLGSDATKDNIKFKTDDNKVIELNETLLKGSANYVIIQNAEGYNASLKFELTGTDLSVDKNKLGGKNSNNFWKVNGGTATLNFYVKESWELRNDTTIAHNEKGDDQVILTIEGLKSDNLDTDGSADDTAKIKNDAIKVDTTGTGENAVTTVTLKKDVLGTDTIKILKTKTTDSYQFKLAGDDENNTDNKIGFAKSDPTWKIKDGKAIYYYEVDEGWTYDKDTQKITYTPEQKGDNAVVLAEITGLADSVTAGMLDEGKAVDSVAGDTTTPYKGTIRLDKFWLSNENVSLSLGSGASYALSLSGGADSVLGFAGKNVESLASWSIGAGSSDSVKTGYYMHTTGEGWSLTSASSILYFQETTNVLASITGLNSSVEEKDLKNIKVAQNDNDTDKREFKGTISLSSGLLSDGAISLSNAEGVEYSLKFANTDADSIGFKGKGVDSVNNDWVVIDGDNSTKTAYYLHTTEKGWSLASDTSIIFSKAATDSLATITGLNSSVEKNDLKNIVNDTSPGNEKFEGTISLKAGLLSDGDLSLSSGAGVAYSLQFYGANGAETLGFDGKTDYSKDKWVINDNSVASLNHAVGKGWSLTGDKALKYFAAETLNVATFTNLADKASVNTNGRIAGVTFDAGTSLITANTSVLSKDSTNPVTFESDRYELIITNGTVASDVNTHSLIGASQTADSIGFATNAAAWATLASDALVYQFKTNEGWNVSLTAGAGTASIADDKWKITYAGESTTNLVSLKGAGLKTNLSSGQLQSGYAVGSVESGKYNISLASYVLNQTNGASIKLTDINTSDSTTYSLKLADGISTTSTNEEITELDFTSSSLGAVAVRTTLEGGWYDTSSIGSVLTYYASVNALNASITGLATTAGASSHIQLQDKQADGKYKTIALGTSALTTLDVNLKNEDGYEYKFVLTDDPDPEKGYATDNKVGFETLDPAWAVASVRADNKTTNTATYYTHTKEGWELNAAGDKITYTSSENTRQYLASITGLSAGIDDTNTGLTFGDDGTVYVKADALGNSDIVIAKGRDADSVTNFKLAFDENIPADSLNADGTAYGFHVNDPGWTLKSNDFIYSYKTDAGWSLTSGDTKISYTAEKDTSLVTITGLASNINADDLNNDEEAVTDPDNTPELYDGVIRIKEEWLVTGKDVSLKVDSGNGADYKLELDEDGKYGFVEYNPLSETDADTDTDGDTDGDGDSDAETETVTYDVEPDYWTLDNSSRDAKLIRNISDGWELNKDGTVVTYKEASTRTLATITSIRGNVNKIVGYDDSDADSDANVKVDYSNHIIYLSEDVLSKDSAKANEIKNAENTPDKEMFKLRFLSESDADGDSDDTVSGFDNEDSPYSGNWNIESTTATFKHTVGEGWTIDDEEGKIIYSPSVSSDLVKLTGLKSGLRRNTDGMIDGITIVSDETERKVTLNKDALGETSVTLSGDYDLEIDNDVPTSATSSNDLTVSSNGVWTYTQNKSKYYELQGDILVYHKGEKVADLGTITGLKSGISLSSANKNALANKNGDTVATFDDNEKTITLTEGALNRGTVELKNSDYKLVLDRVPTAEYTNKTWTISKSSATLKADFLEGYTQEGNKVTYNSGKNNLTMLTITGLNATELANRGAKTGVISIGGVIVDENNHTVSIDKALLGTSALKVAVPSGSEKYTLNITNPGGADIPVLAPGQSPPDHKAVWTLSGTTAVYKEVNPAYYTMESDGTVKYHAETAYKSNNKAVVYATIKGLKSGLKLNANGEIDGIKIAGDTIEMSEDVLGTSKVTLTNGNSGSYSFKFDNVAQPKYKDYRWEVSKNTSAVLKADADAGYTLSANNRTITYTKPKTNATILTITGLKKGIATSATPVTETTTETGTSNTLYIDGTANAIKFKAAEYDEYGKIANDVKGTITLPKEMLGTTSIAFKSKDYEFADIDLSQKYGQDDNIHKYGEEIYAKDDSPDLYQHWRIVSNTTAKFTNYTPEYYSFNADKNSIVYHKEAVNKIKNKDDDLITVTNLPKGLTILENGVGKDDDPYVTLDVTTVKVADVALGTKDIKVTGTDYNVAFADSTEHDPQEGTKAFSVSGTTATLKVVTSAGYTINTTNGTTTIKYQKATSGTPALSISGLAKGLKPNKADDEFKINDETVATKHTAGTALGTYDAEGNFVPVVSLDSSGTKVELDKAALGTTAVTFTTKKGFEDYTWNAETLLSDIKPKANRPMWSISGTTATLKKPKDDIKSAGFEFAVDKKTGDTITNKLSYSKPKDKDTTTLATVKGLAKGLKVDALGNIDGITENNNTITLDKKVLGTTTVTVGNGYKLTFNDSLKPQATSDSYYIEKGKNSTTTVFYGSGKSAGYDNDGETKVVYKAAEKPATPTITITGLKSGLKLNKNNAIDGIDIGTDKKVTLSKSVLGTKTVSIDSKDNDYELALDENVEAKKTYKWFISGTTAYFKGTTPAGYRIEDGKIVYSSKAKTDDNSAALITIKNLKKGLKVGADGKIAGITVDGLDNDNTNKKVTLASNVLGTATVSIETKEADDNKYKDYKLDLDGKVPKALINENLWSVSGNIATYRSGATAAGYVLNETDNTITYTPAKLGTTLATIRGLKTGLEVKNDPNATTEPKSKIEGITVGNITTTTENGETTTTFTKSTDGTGNAIQLGANVLATDPKNPTTLTNANGSEYKLELVSNGENSVPSSAGTDNGKWSGSDGTFIYTITNDAYYVKGDDKITYKPESTSKITITGLSTNVTVDNNGALKVGSDAAVTIGSANNKVITINKAEALAQDKTVMVNGGDYKLGLDTGVNTGSITYEWVSGEKGTATLRQNVPGGSYYSDGTTIKYTENTINRTVASISGLATGLKPKGTSGTDDIRELENSTGTVVTFEESTGTIKLSSGALSASNITLSSNYSLVLDDTDPEIKTEAKKGNGWTLKNGTGSYYEGTKAYYKLSDDGKTITYNAFKPSGKSIVDVKGFNSSVTAVDLDNKVTVQPVVRDDKDSVTARGIVSLSSDVLGISGTSIVTTGSATDKGNYNISLIGGGATAGGSVIPNKWTINGGTAIFGSLTAGIWSINSATSIVYTPPTISSGASITGLKGATVDDKNSISGISLSGDKFLISDTNLLPTKSTDIISLSGGNSSYSLDAAGVETSGNPEKALIVSGTTAKINSVTSAHYDIEKTSIKYVPDTTTNLVEIKGLKSGVSSDDIKYGDSAVSLSSGALGTNGVTLSNKTSIPGAQYQLSLGADVFGSLTTDSVFSIKNTTAIYKEINNAYYKLDSTGSSIDYVKESDKTIFATISGLKSGLKVDEDGKVAGLEMTTAHSLSGDSIATTGIITIGEEAVAKSTIKITGDKDYYKLAVENVPEPDVDGTPSWNYSGTTATYKGNLSAGFTLSDDEKTLTYSAAKSNTELAKVTGLASSTTKLDAVAGDEIVIQGSQVKKTVTANGHERYSFRFGADFEDGAVVNGSTGNDTITVEGFGVTVDGKGGNDYVVLAGYGKDSAGSNVGDTYIYSGGADSIVGFDAYDKLKITGATASADSIKPVGNDIVLGIGTSSITFKDIATSHPDIFFTDSTNKEQKFTWDNNYKIADVVTTPSYALEGYSDFSLTPTLKQSSVIITGGGDKKK